MINLSSGEGFFTINEHSYPVGKYRLMYRGINVGIEEVGNHSIVDPTPYMDWRDSEGAIYVDRPALLEDLRSKIFSRY